MEVHSDDDCFVTSRSRTPSVIDVKSENGPVFSQLPDVIQEAIVSTEYSNPKYNVNRIQTYDCRPHPVFRITRTDSGIDMVDINVTDEKFLAKFGSDLTANFADIRAYGSEAFFQKKNTSDGIDYALCSCATGYIWVYVVPSPSIKFPFDVDAVAMDIQIGTFALQARAITTVQLSAIYPMDNPHQLARICSTVLGKYLRCRIMGCQYESAAEMAITQSWAGFDEKEMGRSEDLDAVLRELCSEAPMPPISDVSLISRSMITRRWDCWMATKTLRRRYFFPKRLVQCFKKSQHDSMDLLSGCFKALAAENKKAPIL
ncbi:hypothetical protein B7494_g3524 [Chlorociboria aeruginascens]|nr:hypothetical protein B7494_g3524 [Chlorociboria aeruginascens]